MINRNKWMMLLLLALCTIMLMSCKSGVRTEQDVFGLEVNSMSTSLGSADSNSLDKTLFFYNINLTNHEKRDVYISTVQIVLNDTVSSRILSKNDAIKLDKTLKAGETLSIIGEMTFDTKGMSKEDIVKLEPFIKDLKITREETINLLQKEE